MLLGSARQISVDEGVHFVELLEAVDPHEFVSVHSVLLHAPSKHLLNLFEGELVLVLRNGSVRLVVEVVDTREVRLLFVHLSRDF